MSDRLSDSGLPSVQRVITDHHESGHTIFKAEDASPTRMIPSGDASFLTIWSTASLPTDLHTGQPLDEAKPEDAQAHIQKG